jgi:hypothetical protein
MMRTSRPFAAEEAAFDLGDDRHEIGDAVDDVVGAGRLEPGSRRRATRRELARWERLGVGKRQAEEIAGDGDADAPRAGIEPLGPLVGEGSFS